MIKKIATIILNRNLPEPTNSLYEHIKLYDGKENDIYILEAGSDENLISKYANWVADTPQIKKEGLRYGRGMNYALLKLWEENIWSDYDAFFLLTNDTELSQEPTINKLKQILEKHKRIGILSPCSSKWGEKYLLKKQKTKYFWFIHNHALLLRRDFLEEIMEKDNPNYFNFIFDGNNFRGCFTNHELIAKAYANDWSAAITSEVFAEHNESYLLNKNDLIKTESYHLNMQLYLEEGFKWLKQKYGFNSHWAMQQYVKSFYENFFEFHPELLNYKI